MVLKAKNICHVAFYKASLQTLSVEDKDLEQEFGSDLRLSHLKLNTSKTGHITHDKKSWVVYGEDSCGESEPCLCELYLSHFLTFSTFNKLYYL